MQFVSLCMQLCGSGITHLVVNAEAGMGCVWGSQSFWKYRDTCRGERRLPIFTLRRYQSFQAKYYTSISGILIDYVFLVKISSKVMKLGLWYVSNNGLWVQLPRL